MPTGVVAGIPGIFELAAIAAVAWLFAPSGSLSSAVAAAVLEIVPLAPAATTVLSVHS